LNPNVFGILRKHGALANVVPDQRIADVIIITVWKILLVSLVCLFLTRTPLGYRVSTFALG